MSLHPVHDIESRSVPHELGKSETCVRFERTGCSARTLKGLGAELKDFYLVTGQYDAVAVIEAPDDEAVAKASMAIGSQGNVRIETLRAFSEDQYRDLVAALP